MICYNCRLEGYWSKIYRTPKHFVPFYQDSLKTKKGKSAETNFADNSTKTDFIDLIIKKTHLYMIDFLIDYIYNVCSIFLFNNLYFFIKFFFPLSIFLERQNVTDDECIIDCKMTDTILQKQIYCKSLSVRMAFIATIAGSSNLIPRLWENNIVHILKRRKTYKVLTTNVNDMEIFKLW